MPEDTTTAGAAGTAQPGNTPAAGAAQPSAQPGSAQQQATPGQGAQPTTPSVSAADLLSEASLTLSPQQEVELLRTRYAASTKDGLSQRARREALESWLSEQGLRPVFKGDKLVGAEPTEKYGEMPNIRLSYDDLSDSERRELAEDPKKVLDAFFGRVSERVQKALLRAKPTIEPQAKVEPLTQEREQATYAWVKSLKSLDGTPKYPYADRHLPILRQMVNDPTAHPALVEFYQKAPEIAAELLIGRLHMAEQRAIARAEKAAKDEQEKKASGERAGHFSPSASGRAVISDPSNPSVQKFIDRIAAA